MTPLQLFLATRTSFIDSGQIASLYRLFTKINPTLGFSEEEFKATQNGLSRMFSGTQAARALYKQYLVMLSMKIEAGKVIAKDFEFDIRGMQVWSNHGLDPLTADDYMTFVLKPLCKQGAVFNETIMQALMTFLNTLNASQAYTQFGVKTRLWDEPFKTGLNAFLLLAKTNINQAEFVSLIKIFFGQFESYSQYKFIENASGIYSQFIIMLYSERPDLADAFMNEKISSTHDEIKINWEDLKQNVLSLNNASELLQGLHDAFDSEKRKQFPLWKKEMVLQMLDVNTLSFEDAKQYIMLLAQVWFSDNLHGNTGLLYKNPMMLLTQMMKVTHFEKEQKVELGCLFQAEVGKIFIQDIQKTAEKAPSEFNIAPNEEEDKLNSLAVYPVEWRRRWTSTELYDKLMQLHSIMELLFLLGISPEKMSSIPQILKTAEIIAGTKLGNDTHMAQAYQAMEKFQAGAKLSEIVYHFALLNPEVSEHVNEITDKMTMNEQAIDDVHGLPMYYQLLHYQKNEEDRKRFANAFTKFVEDMEGVNVFVFLRRSGPRFNFLYQVMGEHAFQYISQLYDDDIDLYNATFDKYLNPELVPLYVEFFKKIKFDITTADKQQKYKFAFFMHIMTPKLPTKEHYDHLAYIISTSNSLDVLMFKLINFHCATDRALQTDLKLLSESNYKEYNEGLSRLKTRFEKANAQAKRKGVDFNLFMDENEATILMMIYMMDDKAFDFLARYIANSSMALERVMADFKGPILPNESIFVCRRIFEKFGVILMKESLPTDNFLAIIKLMYMMENICTLSDHEAIKTLKDNFYASCLRHVHESKSVDELKIKIMHDVMHQYFILLGVEMNEDKYEMIFQRVPFYVLSDLLSGRRKMSGQSYESLYDEFILADLTGKKFGEGSDSRAIQLLEQHNAQIVQTLVDSGIDIKSAFAYPYKDTFHSGGISQEVDLEQTIKSLWGYLDLILVRAKELDLKSVVKSIEAFQASFKISREDKSLQLSNTDATQIYRALVNASAGQSITRLDALCRALESAKSADPSFQEYAGHIKRETETLNPHIKQEKSNQQAFVPKKTFEVRMWDKNAVDTFCLGRYVGCCLSVEGGQFQAMVERRMDKAMFVPVVVDVETGKPVSLAWMFFAKPEGQTQPPYDVYVVANFIEIADSYERKFRDQIVNALLEFIGMYAQKIGAKGFIMRPLTYGLIPDFTQFERINMTVEKIGGFFAPTGNETDYYLKAAGGELNFHQFRSSKPQIEAGASSSATSLTLYGSGQKQNTTSTVTATTTPKPNQE